VFFPILPPRKEQHFRKDSDLTFSDLILQSSAEEYFEETLACGTTGSEKM
jgi:hypothetical protein